MKHTEKVALAMAWYDSGLENRDEFQTLIESLLVQPERHELQTKGEHPAPCARHCEANAFKIVIKNLKAQLAQPEQEPYSVQQAYAMAQVCLDLHEALGCKWGDNPYLAINQLKASPPQRTEQEPVAHCKVRPLRGDESFPKVEIDWVNQPVPGPLYAAPPQRKPLTDEQIEQLEQDTCAMEFPETVRAIEAAHGIKENT